MTDQSEGNANTVILLAKHLLAKRRRFISTLHVCSGCDRDRLNAYYLNLHLAWSLPWFDLHLWNLAWSLIILLIVGHGRMWSWFVVCLIKDPLVLVLVSCDVRWFVWFASGIVTVWYGPDK